MPTSNHSICALPIAFTKMHGLGNDFMLIDSRQAEFNCPPNVIAALANRHTGVGFDQLLVIERAQSAAADFHYRIFNSDGYEASHCGNGARCFAKYLLDNQLFDFKRPVRLSVQNGIISVDYLGTFRHEMHFQVEMGVPNFTPFTLQQTDTLYQPIKYADATYPFGIVSLGNPHAVCQVPDLIHAPVASLGAYLQTHTLFPERVNVEFMEVINRRHIRLRVFERGVGETQACGTGACAAVAVGIARGTLASQVRVSLLGGDLSIQWLTPDAPLYLRGTAKTVFSGQLSADYVAPD